MARNPSQDTITIQMGTRGWTKFALKRLAGQLRQLEKLIGGSKNKGIVNLPSGGTSTESYSYELTDPDNDSVVWAWTSQLSYDWQMDKDRPIEAFCQAFQNELKRLTPPKSSVNDIATLAKKLDPKDQEHVRTLLQQMVGKPTGGKKPRQVRDPAQKMLNKLIAGKTPPLPKDGKRGGSRSKKKAA